MNDDWRHRSACRDEDPELFHPVGTTGPALLQIEEAKKVCARCPVAVKCLDDALARGIEYGIYGGQAEDERREISARLTEGREKHGPLLYDPLTVEHLVAGHRMPGASRHDQAEAAVRLHQQGWELIRVAEFLVLGQQTIANWVHRNQAGEPLNPREAAA